MTLSLRARLLLGVLVLAAVGLVTADVVTYTSLRTFLFQQADDSLDATAASMAAALASPNVIGGQFPGDATNLMSLLSITGDCVEVRTLTGRAVAGGAQCLSRLPQAAPPLPPRLPDEVSLPAPSTQPNGRSVVYFTAPTQTGSTVVTSRSGRFPASVFADESVTGPRIPDYTVVQSRDRTGTLHLSSVVLTGEPITLKFATSIPGITTSGSTSVTPPVGSFPDALIGMGIEAPGIPKGTFVAGGTRVKGAPDTALSSLILSKAVRRSGTFTLNLSTVVRKVTVLPGPPAPSFRVRASVSPGTAQPFMLLISAPLTGVDSTLHRLLIVEVLVTAGILLALVVLGLWVVRLGLRPLEKMGQTASAIAGGDLSRRIEPDDDTTEVGRLGHALNSMLTQIEAAFRAREATEQKLRRFVADASHELRTPLAAVRAYAELFSRGASHRPADLERSMHGITRESERMTVMVDELILLAHLDDGRPLLHEAVDLEGVVADSVETARTVEPDRPLEMETTHAVVIGDHDRLRQLVDNLLSNVRAHTPPTAAARVVLRVTGADAVLEVSDTGPGMRPDEVAHVFERFYRTDGSRARASGGSGLGLAIVSALAAAHGGKASASSTPGEGSTFTISLPLAGVTPNGDASSPSAAETAQPAAGPAVG